MPELTVATFNTLYGLAPRSMRYQPFDLVDACRTLDVDVLAMQEVWRPDGWPSGAAAVADALGYVVHEIPLGRAAITEKGPRIKAKAGSGAGEGDWMLAVLSRLPVRASQTTRLPPLPGDPVDRVVLELDVWVDGRSFAICATHLPHLERGSLLLRRALRRSLPALDHPAAFVGDLNMWGPLAGWLLPGWRRAVKGRSWPSRWPHSQLDHVLVTPSVGVLGGEVPKLVRSDHRPARARLRF